MSTLVQLQDRRTELLQHISFAAKGEDITQLLSRTDELRQVEKFLADFRHVEDQARRFLKPEDASENSIENLRPQFTAGHGQGSHAGLSGREAGAAIRKDFIQRAEAEGIRLFHRAGAIYKSKSGKRIGIAVATERQRDRWFLGLRSDRIDSAVLLCATTAGGVLDIILPSAFWEAHRGDLSTSGDQTKFNVVRRDGRLSLSVPKKPSVAVSEYLGAWGGLE